MKPRIGETTSGMIILVMTPCHSTPSKPRPTITAPIRPPIKACVELLGRPPYQVMRFQAMPPTSAARIMRSVTWPGGAMPVPMVAATLRVTKAPTKFITAERSTAARGERAWVETEVAMALAVSWKPLVKSKKRAMAITTTTRAVSGILDGHTLEDVGDILGAIDRLLEQREDVLPLDEGDGVAPLLEQGADRLPCERVSPVLQLMEADPVLAHILARIEVIDGRHQFLPDLDEDLPHLPGFRPDGLDPIDDDGIGGLLGQVENVIERGSQGVDVVPIEGRDEGAVEFADDVVGDLIPAVLEVAQCPSARLEIARTLEQLEEGAQALHEIGGVVPEEGEEVTLAGDEAKCHGSLLVAGRIEKAFVPSLTLRRRCCRVVTGS